MSPRICILLIILDGVKTLPIREYDKDKTKNEKFIIDNVAIFRITNPILERLLTSIFGFSLYFRRRK